MKKNNAKCWNIGKFEIPKKATGVVLAVVAVLFGSCAMMPKEEELQKAPIVEAYQQEEFKMSEVVRGDLKHYETMNAIVQMVHEQQLSFPYDDMTYKSFDAKEGEWVKEGQLLAELDPKGKESQVGDSSQLSIYAPFDGLIVHARDIEAGEKSVGGQIVIIINESDEFVLSVFTPYWRKFTIGETYTWHYATKDYEVKAVDATDLGLSATKHPEEEGEPSRVYFTVKAPELRLMSGQSGDITILLEEKEDVLYIPLSAITVINEDEIVYVENQDGIRTAQKITTGMKTKQYAEVVDGLSEGDKVILD